MYNNSYECTIAITLLYYERHVWVTVYMSDVVYACVLAKQAVDVRNVQ